MASGVRVAGLDDGGHQIDGADERTVEFVTLAHSSDAVAEGGGEILQDGERVLVEGVWFGCIDAEDPIKASLDDYREAGRRPELLAEILSAPRRGCSISFHVGLDSGMPGTGRTPSRPPAGSSIGRPDIEAIEVRLEAAAAGHRHYPLAGGAIVGGGAPPVPGEPVPTDGDCGLAHGAEQALLIFGHCEEPVAGGQSIGGPPLQYFVLAVAERDDGTDAQTFVFGDRQGRHRHPSSSPGLGAVAHLERLGRTALVVQPMPEV